MKAEVFVCLLAAFLQAEASISFRFSPEQKSCIEELNLNHDEMRSFHLPSVTVENSTQFNDFTHCSWVKLGFQNEDGVINYGKLSQSYEIVLKAYDDVPTDNHSSEEILCDAINFCGNYPPVHGDNHGETAVKVQNCLTRFYLHMKDKYRGRLHNYCHN